MQTATLTGTQPHLDWIAARLAARGLAVERVRDDSVPAALQLPDGPALRLPAVDETFVPQDTRAEACTLWHPAGSELGFALFLGASPADLPRLAPWLDALAPLPGAWLHAGPPGAALFCQRILAAMQLAAGLCIQAGLTPPGETPAPPDWGKLLLVQQHMMHGMQALARDYCQQHGADSLASDALADFAAPPARQAHFALNLARVLRLAQPAP